MWIVTGQVRYSICALQDADNLGPGQEATILLLSLFDVH